MLNNTQRNKLKSELGWNDMKIKAYELRKFGPEGSKPLDPGPNVDSRGSDLSFFEDAKQDFQEEVVQGFGEDVKRRRQNVQETREATASGEQSTAEGVFQNVGQVVGTAGDALMRGISAIGKAITPQKQEEQVSEAVKPILESISNSETVQEATEKWQKFAEENPRAARNLGATFNIGEAVFDVGLGGLVGTGVKTAKNAGKEIVQEGIERGTRKMASIFQPGKTFNSADEVFEEASKVIDNVPEGRTGDATGLAPDANPLAGDPALRAAREAAEADLPSTTIQEKFINMQPEMRKVYDDADPNLVADYMNATALKNADVTNPSTPSVMEFGGDQVRAQLDEINSLLEAPGNEIGQFRTKYATVKAPVDELKKIGDAFVSELDKLNLTIKNAGKGGSVTVKANKKGLEQTASQADIKVLNDLYQGLKTTSQSPTLDNLVDLRNTFDNKINFGKSAQEVSGSVDPLSRTVRAQIADSMKEMVGRQNASQVDRYAEVMKAKQVLEDFTGRRAGGEYLLRLALSGRGGEAAQVMQTVLDLTGRNLMIDAKVMTDMINRFANDSQKTLFSQGIKNAGIETIQEITGAARGDLGSVANLLRRGVESTIDEADVIMRAANTKAPGRMPTKNANSTPPTDLPGDNTPGGSATKAPDGGGTPTN